MPRGAKAPGEDWTVIVVTDHGHQPQPGFGHGFQSPDETDTLVIVDGPQFGDSVYNPEYEIVDVTPTVLSLFGAPECRNCDDVPLTSLRGSDSDPLTQDELQELLNGQMAANDYPNIIVNVALSLRTIVAFLPYYVHGAVCLPHSATSCTSRRTFPRSWSPSSPACTVPSSSRCCRRHRRSRSYRSRRRRSRSAFRTDCGVGAASLRRRV